MPGVLRALRVIARPRWRQWLALAAISGVLAGGAIEAGAAARRTATAFPRLLSLSRTANADVAVDRSSGSYSYGNRYLHRVEALPQVGSASRQGGVDLEVVTPQGRIDKRLNATDTATGLVAEDDRTFRSTEMLRLLDGRLPALDRPGEMAINPELEQLMGWHIGSRPQGLQLFPPSAHDRRGDAVVAKGIPVDMTVVGITRNPTELLFPPEDRAPRMFLSHAFWEAHPKSAFYALDLVHLRQVSDLTAFRDAITSIVEKDFPRQTVSVVSTREGADSIAKSLRPQDTALWALCILGVLIAALLLAQGLAANLRASVTTFGVLRELGLGRAERRRVCLLAATVVGLGATAMAVGVAYLLSPLGPISVARAAEPHPGFSANWAFLAGGGGLILALSVALTALPGARIARAVEASDSGAQTRSSTPLSAVIGRRGASVTAVEGVRLAYQSDRRVTGVSTSAALGAVAATILIATGAVAFTSNLNHLTHTPSLYGWNWDAAPGTTFGTIPGGAVGAIVHQPYVVSASAATLGLARIGSTTVPGVGISGLTANSPYLTILSGRRPSSDNEILVGSRTLSAIHADVGDSVVATINGRTQNLRVVGTAVFPALGVTRFEQTGLGSGIAGTAALFPQDPQSGGRYNYLFMRLQPGGMPQLLNQLGKSGCPDGSCLLDGRPTAINGYTKARDLTLTGLGVLAFAFLISLSRAVITSVGRRRREFALLKALGMTRLQVARTVGWQATVVALTALLVGLPLGVVLGRLTWTAFANDLGVLPNPIVAPGLLLLVIGSVAFATLVIGAIGAARARRTRTAHELRVG